MTNQQVRLLVSVLVVFSGAISANASQLDVNVGIFLIFAASRAVFDAALSRMSVEYREIVAPWALSG